MAHTFSVWAPHAATVDVVVAGGRGDERHRAAATAGGWYAATVEGAGPGTRYAFSLDGGPPRPDPRSPLQPDGIDGFSEVVDHGRFVWTDGGWHGVDIASAVVYELHVGTFTAEGTFDAAIEKLPHLRDLGVDAVELMPVAHFSGERGWGYDGVDLFAPHTAYGGPDGLKRLVDAAHGAGLAVLLDVVYNHLGPAGNYLHEFGPYFTDRYETPWGMAVNLDGPGSQEVRRFFGDNALMWLRDYHFDGLRLDAVHAIVDTSPVHFLEELASRVDELAAAEGRRLFLVAESEHDQPRLITPRPSGGYGLQAQWYDHFHHALHAFLTGERSGYYEPFGSLEVLAAAIERPPSGADPAAVPASGYVAFLQNHDQIGNRARGDRSSHLLSTAQLELAAGVVLTAPFVPLLYMGEEWGASTPFQYFTDHPDPELGAAVSDGRRREFGAFGWSPEDIPDPQALATFEGSRLRWEELAEEPHASLLRWHRELLALRRSIPGLGPGPFPEGRVRCSSEDRWLVVERSASVAVVANLRDEPQRVPLDTARYSEVLASSSAGADVSMGDVALGPWGFAIVGSRTRQ